MSLLLIRVVSTVPGTVAGIQPFNVYEGCESCSPEVFTLPTLIHFQPELSSTSCAFTAGSLRSTSCAKREKKDNTRTAVTIRPFLYISIFYTAKLQPWRHRFISFFKSIYTSCLQSSPVHLIPTGD